LRDRQAALLRRFALSICFLRQTRTVGGLLVAAIGPGWTMLFNAATSLAEVAIRFGAANDAYLVLFDTTIQRLIPRDLLARVISFDWFSDAATKPPGLAVVGPIAARVGMSTVFWAAAIGALAVTALTVIVHEVRTMGVNARGSES
jgi:hypothetical protein